MAEHKITPGIVNDYASISEIRKYLSVFSASTCDEEFKDAIGRLVTFSLDYIGNDLSALLPDKCQLPLTEDECMNKIIQIINSKPRFLECELQGKVFQQYYQNATDEIATPIIRKALANLILSSIEEDEQLDEIPDLDLAIDRMSIRSFRTQRSCSSSVRGAGGRLVPYAAPDNASIASSEMASGLSDLPTPNYISRLAQANGVNVSDDIVQNAVYSFLGIQGKYLKKDVCSGRLKLDPIHVKNLTAVQSSMLLRLSELGYYHDQVAKYANIATGYNAIGCVGQAFISKLKTELSLFHGQVSLLQDEIYHYRENNARLYNDPNKNWLDRDAPPLTLMKLLCWCMDPLRRMQWLAKIADACQLTKGGELLSIIYDYLNHGDPLINNLVSDVLTVCCTPLVHMISKWMLEGGIDDNYSEFFIEAIDDVGADRLWHDKFRLRLSMLPKFITRELADKILGSGKSVNFLREICKVEEAVKDRAELKHVIDNNVACIFSPVPDTNWHAAIETCYIQTSKHVLNVMVGPHKLLDHLQGMRRYLLLGQGDFVSIFIEHLKDELEKVGTEIYSHDLSSMLDASLRCTNAQHDDPEILNHLDVVVKTPFPGDCGWDVISLQYIVGGPLATMLEPAMPTYKSLFKPLWRIKYMEFVLSNRIWKVQMVNAKALRLLDKEIRNATYKLHLFTSEIMHFVHQMQYYVLFEVIECNWVELQSRVLNATALDDILEAHSKFLKTIKAGCFVNTSTNMEGHLEVVYENIVGLEVWQSKFYDECFKELAARKKMDNIIRESEISGKYGVTTEQIMERDQERKLFEQNILSFARVLENYSSSYSEAVVGFLLALNSSDDPNLQLFGTRLDFNEYYKKRDINLSKPLTFEHMRLSSVMGNIKSRYVVHPQLKVPFTPL